MALSDRDLANALVARNAPTIRRFLKAWPHPDTMDNGVMWVVEQAVRMAYDLNAGEARTFITIMVAEV